MKKVKYLALEDALQRAFKGKAMPEYRFHSTRRWRIDYAFPDIKLAVEIEGGIWNNGGHVRPSGFIKDMEKYNALTLEGWNLLRFTSTEALKNQTKIIKAIKKVYKNETKSKYIH